MGERLSSTGRKVKEKQGLPCRRLLVDISFPNLRVGTCGAASDTYRGTWYGHFTGLKIIHKENANREGWGRNQQENNGEETQKSLVNRFPRVRCRADAILGLYIRTKGCITVKLSVPERKDGMAKGESGQRREEERILGKTGWPNTQNGDGLKRNDSFVMRMSAPACLQTSHWYFSQGAWRQRFQCQPELFCYSFDLRLLQPQITFETFELIWVDQAHFLHAEMWTF